MAERPSEVTGSSIVRRDFSVFLEPGFWVALILNMSVAGATAAAIYVGLEKLP